VGGDKPIGLAIGVVVLVLLVLLPGAIVAIFYLLANIHAIFVGTDFDSNTINVGLFATLLVVTVALYLLIMAAAVSLLGRALSPKQPKD
jgi:hypothetical protein